MSDPTPLATTVVFNRFGLGARTGDLAKVGSDPRGLLKADLRPEVLAEYWGLSSRVLADTVSPGSGAVKPIAGLFV